MEGPADGPPDEAYGRVTNPDRYAVLHPAVRALVDDVTARFVAERVEGWRDPDLAGGVPVLSTVRLVPAGGGAPITIALTAFPGAVIRFGRWYMLPFPSCGCDACDEKPDDVVTEMHRYVDAVVAGRFREELRPDRGRDYELHHEFWGDDWRTASTSVVWFRDAQRLGPAARVAWPPWPLR